ncbi:hypothetical protein CkaCkLH20_12541 [Colletotrichum karsti]|uniref:Hydrophobin n=1 Tax=Colletotrichum karsti TaxID=1095194 RepID=A0A9P6HUB3_9PEZI|nr:uncharacterized protein CkaCkLH20_12541 [Colletotrichum karsti]KAF9869932.1 hypothetical protein CkaCkLH20_12541 [Colletotrichum karsti]
MKIAAQVTIAFLAAATLALPVDTEQRPMIGEVGSQAHPAVASGTPVSQSSSPNQASPSKSNDDLIAALKSIFNDKEMSQVGLGKGCFCANGSICCNTAKGLDCTQGLCGI